ncbi:MAG: AsmA family protein [Acidobacteriia bacterium]|nr:AsmA family protein [Terriglobia bacterium]
MRKRKWLRWVLAVAVLTFAASAAFSRALQTAAARRYLITRLVASFGRPVDVARFDFSLLDGARLEAHSVTVSEDPGFGNEYFLRAETLTAGLRWSALLSGRFEFGSVTLSRPSLNLVRDADGRWNIERWLPPAPSAASRPGFVGPISSGTAQAQRIYRINVDGGRINFKQQDDKSPFALLDVSGNVARDTTGRWQLDLQARPMRAGVELQDIGMFRLRGTIAGTSARLQPAELNLTWRAASVADALRLARQQDYGIRGTLALDLNARVGPPDASSPTAASGGAQWAISGVARLTGIHAWNLPGRDTDPSANLSLDAAWRLGEARADIRKLLLEMPGSRLQGVGELNWGRGFHPQLHIETSTLGLQDVLSWYRALRPDVAEDLRAEGSLGVDVTLAGWPLQLQQGAIASAGGTLSTKSLPAPLHFGAVNAGLSRGRLDFAPTQFSIASAVAATANAAAKSASEAADVPSTSAFFLRASIFPDSGGVFRWPPNWNCSIEGATPRSQDWLMLSRALAQPMNSDWTAEGGVAVKMRGARQSDAPAAVWLGTMDFRGLAVSPAYVNQPVRLLKTHVEYSPAGQTITVAAAEALGAAWHGTISRKTAAPAPPDSAAARPGWTFDLTADRLDMAELDRWLGPRARPGFLARLTGFGSDTAAAPLPDARIARLAAQGRLRVTELDLTPMRFDQIDAQVELNGRALKIGNAKADFFGGKASGALDTNLVADPSYDFQGRFDRVNLAQLALAVPSLVDRIAGTASATLSISTHGIGRQTLIASMAGKGTLDVRNAQINGVDFSGAAPGATSSAAEDSPSSSFSSVAGDFRIEGRSINLSKFVLDRAQARLNAEGRIDFSHALDIRLIPALPNNNTPLVSTSAAPPSFLLNGTLENPKLEHVSAAPKPAPRRTGR